MNQSHASQILLRRALYADAIASGGMGLIMLALAGELGELLGIHSSLLRPLGIGFLPWAALLAWLASRSDIPRRVAWGVVCLNLLYAVDSILLLFTGWVELTTLGYLFVVIQAVAVAGLAELQWFGLRRAAPRPA